MTSTTLVTLLAAVVAYVLKVLLDFHSAVRSIRNHPGTRTVIDALSPIGMMVVTPIPVLAHGNQRSWKYKHAEYAELGYDILSSVAAFPRVNTDIFVADAAVIKEITTNRSRFPKPVDIYKVISFFGDNIVGTEGDEWKRFRKIIAPSFSERNNRLVWDGTVKIMNDLFEAVWGSKEEVTVDNSTDLTIPRYLVTMIEERRLAGRQEGRHDLFSSLLDANEDEKDGQTPLTDSELFGNMFIFLLAGHETTAHTLAFTLGLLALYPAYQEKLHQHVRGVMGGVSHPTYEMMNSFTESMALFYETLRLFPAVINIPKRSAEDTSFVTQDMNGNTVTVPVPRGTGVILDVAGLHYNPKYWQDPHEFKPERFLGDWPRDAFLPFSGGARSCVGRRFSETEAIAILAMLVSRYTIEVKEEPQFSGECFGERKERILKAKRGVTLTPVRMPLVFRRR